MSKISQVKLPTNETYDIRDEETRQLAEWNANYGVKNVLKINSDSNSIFTKENDNSVNINGTSSQVATGIYSFFNLNYAGENIQSIPAGTWIVSGTNMTNLRFRYSENGSGKDLGSTGQSLTFTVSSNNLNNNWLRIEATGIYTYSNQYVRIMLRPAFIEDATFKEYAESNTELTEEVNSLYLDTFVVPERGKLIGQQDVTSTQITYSSKATEIGYIRDWYIGTSDEDLIRYATWELEPGGSQNLFPPSLPKIQNTSGLCVYTTGSGKYYVKGKYTGTASSVAFYFALAAPLELFEGDYLCLGNSAVLTSSDIFRLVDTDNNKKDWSIVNSTNRAIEITSSSGATGRIYKQFCLQLRRNVDYDFYLSPQLFNTTIETIPDFKMYDHRLIIRSFPYETLSTDYKDTNIILPRISLQNWAGKAIAKTQAISIYKGNSDDHSYTEIRYNVKFTDNTGGIIQVTGYSLPSLGFKMGKNVFFMSTPNQIKWAPAASGSINFVYY